MGNQSINKLSKQIDLKTSNRKLLAEPKRRLDKLGMKDEGKIFENHSKLVRNLNRESNYTTYDSLRHNLHESIDTNQPLMNKN